MEVRILSSNHIIYRKCYVCIAQTPNFSIKTIVRSIKKSQVYKRICRLDIYPNN